MTALRLARGRRSSAAAVALAIAGAVALAAPAVSFAATPGDSLPFASAVFRATHNSYSGNVGGSRGSITAQLDSGVRFVEFDVHDNGYATNHDYSIGHNGPGDAVDHTGNPASNLLRDWLQSVSAWSAAHPSHAPLVVMLDLKDDLTDNPSFAAGNLSALNQELRDVFGSRLLMAKDVPGALGTIGSLRGRVLTLLSGDAGSRTEYRRDAGFHPAVAINARGQVVEVHDSGSGALWYWTGTYGADGRITWLRHGRYDSGTTPAVALSDNGQLVEVHKSQTADTLWYHVGTIGDDGDITWSPSRQYDTGVLPTIRFTGGGTTVREVHRSQSSSQNWNWTGTLSAGAMTVAWSGNGKTSDALFDTATATAGGARVSVRTGADGAAPAQTLLYSTGLVSTERIRYVQTAFDEFQAGDAAVLQEGALFYASTASNSAFITAARQGGHIVRGWDFDSASYATNPPANYPATNHPSDGWYTTLLTQSGAVS
ncbi:Ca2+-dependent phosphoinositide-specific phospholipase C [Dactylosporangium sp. NPDC000244]|uniref:Ca2+-dependent phosphoinositide-specific phospholipase C n=1 Tax=Dactylosporangium sp. NPDC000244 TaxID=3154365 RepID=UPI0033266EA2